MYTSACEWHGHRTAQLHSLRAVVATLGKEELRKRACGGLGGEEVDVGASVHASKGRQQRATHRLIDTADDMELVFGYLASNQDKECKLQIVFLVASQCKIKTNNYPMLLAVHINCRFHHFHGSVVLVPEAVYLSHHIRVIPGRSEHRVRVQAKLSQL